MYYFLGVIELQAFRAERVLRDRLVQPLHFIEKELGKALDF